MKLAIRWIVSLLIGAFFIWLAARQWPMDQLWSEDRFFEGTRLAVGGSAGWSLELLWLPAAFLVLAAVHFLRVMRWRPLLLPLARHDFGTLNRVCAVSFMALFIFPLRLGELARPYLIAGHGKVRKSAAFGTIAVERVMDGLMMALLLFLVLLTLPATKDTAAYASLRAGSGVALIVFLSALGLLLLAHFNKPLAIRLVNLVLRPFSVRLADKIGGMVERFIDGLKALPTPRHVFLSILWTVSYWAINGLFYYFMARAFGMGPWVGLPVAYAMMAAAAVGMMIPNSPANVGSFWYFLLLPLYVSGLPASEVAPLAFALGVWFMMLLQYLVFAGYFLATGKINLKKIWEIQKQKASE